jgi:hypothetical protein
MCGGLATVILAARLFRYPLAPLTLGLELLTLSILALLHRLNSYLLRDRKTFARELDSLSSSTRAWGSIGSFGIMIFLIAYVIVARHVHRCSSPGYDLPIIRPVRPLTS